MAKTIQSEGTLIEGFEDATDWTVTGTGATLTDDTTRYKQGTQSLQLSSTNAAYGVMTRTISTTAFDSATTISFWIYIHDSTKLHQTGTTSLYISSTTNFSKYFSWTFNQNRFRDGWNKIIINKDEFSNTGVEAWSNTMIRLRLRILSLSGQTATVNLDNFTVDGVYRPKILLTFDDGRVSQYTEGFSYMNTKGFPGTLYLSGDNLDKSASFVSTTQALEMVNAGWRFSSHGGNDLTSLGSVAEMVADIQENQAVINDAGLSRERSVDHYAYPNGAYNDDVLTAFRQTGLITGRTILTDTPHGLTSNPLDNPELVKVGYIVDSTTLATVQDRVDKCISNKQTLILVFHSLVTTPSVSTEWAIADFQSLIDYIETAVNAGSVDVLTITDWWKFATNAPEGTNESINRITGESGGVQEALNRALSNYDNELSVRDAMAEYLGITAGTKSTQDIINEYVGDGEIRSVADGLKKIISI